jgi:DNA-binding XRE family transcriptional regulator
MVTTMMNVQIIQKEGKPEWAVIPYDLYLQLLAETDFAEDLELLEEAVAAEATESIPAEVVHRIIEGDNLIQVWRKYRGLTQQELARQAGISRGYLAELETGRRTTSSQTTLTAIAKVLNLTASDLTREELDS